MRDGAVVLSGETAAYRDEQLINAMTPVSRDHALSDTQKLWLSLPGNRRTQPQDFPVLRVEDLTGEGFIDLNLEIRAGEIVGLAGLVGSGAPNLPKPYTACVHRAPGESGWRTARLAATAPAPGWPAGWSICRKTARSRGCFSMRRCAGTR